MSLERKQHADLIRHREFNALRQLMLQRNPQKRLTADQDVPSTQVTRFEPSKALSQINELEVQMSQQLLGNRQDTNFSHTRIAALSEVVVAKTEMNPDAAVVREAAEHFASNRMLQAQTMLEQAIGEKGLQHDHVRTWLALLDFFRATNQPDRFEAYALDFSVRFGRSTPAWISFPLLAIGAAKERTAASNAPDGVVDWTSPLFLMQAELRELQSCLLLAQKSSSQVVLDWHHLVSVDSEYDTNLQETLNLCASLPLQCKVHGVAMLESVFDDGTAHNMLAHLALLRCQNQMQKFEDVALDYSAKFEVSPPDWVSPLCRFETADGLSDVIFSAAPQMQSPELYGALEGEHAATLLHTLTEAEDRVIRCDRLVRCDAPSTKALVQWAEAASYQGAVVEFKNVHRLIAPYFVAQGLTRFAKVSIRRD